MTRRRLRESTKGPARRSSTRCTALAISNDGIVYVGDRVNNRIQSFRLDGTFVKEVFIERQTTARFGTGIRRGVFRRQGAALLLRARRDQ